MKIDIDDSRYIMMSSLALGPLDPEELHRQAVSHPAHLLNILLLLLLISCFLVREHLYNRTLP